ncbi:MAG: hypothetical protein ACE5EX_07835 [Phycisphaerae bacterium]
MFQCSDCEYYRPGPDGARQLTCDPFSNIKEPACLAKWQLVKLDVVMKSHQATLDMYKRLAPLQERMFNHMERELDESEEADSWKYADDDDDDDPFTV